MFSKIEMIVGRSTTKFLFTLNGGEVSWKISEQLITKKAEYIAVSDDAKDIVWLKKFIINLGFVPMILDLTPFLCKNNGMIALAKEPRSH